MSQEKISQKKIEELNTREQELKGIIDEARNAVERLSIEKMNAIGSHIEEEEYFNLDKTKGTDVKEVEESSNEEQHKELSAIRRKKQREFAQEKRVGKPNKEEDQAFRETTQKLTAQDREITGHLNEQIRSDMLEETDNLLSRLDELEKMEEKGEENKREEKKKKEERELTKMVSKMVQGIFKNANETKQEGPEINNEPISNNEENIGTTEEELIEGIADLLKENKISEIIVSGGRKKINKKEKIITWGQDLDSRMSLWLLNNFNKKGGPEKIYTERARSTILDTKGREKEPQHKVEGTRFFIDAGGTWLKEEPQETIGSVRVFLDAGGTWLKIENGPQKTTTIHIDHHGVGQRDATSGAKMVYQIMEKADLLKEKPEWLSKFIDFVNKFDNLTYLEDVDSDNKKIFNEEYFKNVWPKTLYAISREIPFNVLLELCQTGKIKDPSLPFTDEELKGELGKTKIGEFTIAELCERALVGDVSRKEKNIGGVINTLKGVEDCQRYAKQEKLNLENTSLGKIIYQNFGKIKTNDGKYYMAKIERALAFIGTKAAGYNTFVNWNAGESEFFINSNHKDLSKIVEKLNEADPDCAIDVRGVMAFGQIKNLTEEQFLNIIDPNILKKPEDKDTSVQEEGLTPEEEKILAEAEANILADKKIIAEAENGLEKLYAELKTAQFKEKREAEALAKEKATNKKLKVAKTPKKAQLKDKVDTEGQTASVETENVEIKKEIGSYSAKLIEKEVLSLLKKVKEISEIKNFEINGKGKEMTLDTTVTAFFFDIKVQAVFENKGNGIAVKNYKIDAKWPAKGKAEKALTPHLNEISNMLKSYIEKDSGKKVDKIWIEDGELKAL